MVRDVQNTSREQYDIRNSKYTENKVECLENSDANSTNLGNKSGEAVATLYKDTFKNMIQKISLKQQMCHESYNMDINDYNMDNTFNMSNIEILIS